MSRLPGASGARVMAMCRAAARFQAGRTPGGDVGERRTWPRSARLRLGAWNALMGTKKMSPMFRGAAVSEVKGWKVKFLQLNLGRAKEAQNLLM